MRKRGKKRTLVGEVVSTAMDKTVVVQVSRRVLHPVYKKYITKKKKFHAHCEKECSMGDTVKIISSRPLSKMKQWRVSEVLRESRSR